MAQSNVLHPKSARTSVIPTLPLKIWKRIALLLPDYQLRRLYTVNRTFFYISLPLLLNEVSLSGLAGFNGRVAGKYAKILDDPTLGSHVCTLTFDLGGFGPNDGAGRLLPRNKPSQSGSALVAASLINYFYAISHPARKKEVLTFNIQAQKTKAVIASLEQLTNLVLKYRCYPKTPDYKIRTDIFLLGWSTFGTRLHSLSLYMTPESFLSVFSVDVHFPQLNELVLDIDKDPPVNFARFPRESKQPTKPRPPPAPFISFVRRHLETLTFLRIISLYSIDREEFYTGIGALPNLQKFYLEEKSDCHEYSPSTTFLLLNSATLSEFSWSLLHATHWETMSMPPAPAQIPFNVTLPALKKLSLSLSWSPHGIAEPESLADFIGLHSQTLTHLTFNGKVRYQEDKLHVFLRALRTSHLRLLEIPLTHVWISTFPAFALYLPHLETLKISFWNMCSDVKIEEEGSGSDSDPDLRSPTKVRLNEKFIEKMQSPLIRNWHLHSLFFHKRPFDYDLEMVFLVAQVIVKSLPHLQFIGGMTRQDFLKIKFWSQATAIF